jgi:sugar/nucleoside kinase (ribokinase family)
MQDAEAHSELHDPQGQAAISLVVIGHAGISVVRTKTGCRESPGGSGYAVAASAAALIGSRVGLVAQVGLDLDLSLLRRLMVSLEGVTRLRGASARLCIDQFDDGSRSFRADLGVATDVQLDSFPSSYLNASFIHLGTAPPKQQLEWLRFLRGRPCLAQISADMFEHYVATDPGICREVCDHADLVFLNQQEYDGLYGGAEANPPRLILKAASEGATLLAGDLVYHVPAQQIHVVDPTGGGEVLAGVFLALRADGRSECDALEYAVRAATSCVEDHGVTGPQLAAELEAIRRKVGDESAGQRFGG